VKKKIDAAQEDLKKKVDDVHKDVNDLQKKVDELLKKVDIPKQQDQEGEVVVAGVRDEALLVGARGLRRTEHGSTGSPTS
jgi:uncharacterized protein YlxW (UPF0749 family)